ncbi:MAG TPA: hypothetical protein VI341_13675 [Actinomycetota bacterium]
MKRRPKVGDRVVARFDIWDYFTGLTVPKGTVGEVVAAGIDAAYGMVNVRFPIEGVTDGLPLQAAGPDAAVAEYQS